MLDTTNTAALICLVSLAMSHPADMTFSSRNRDPSLTPLIFDAVVRMLEWRIFPGCGAGSTEVCLGGRCFLAVHILSPSTNWQSTGWASRGMSSTRPATAKNQSLLRIERELGAGGMATVYLARDLKHDREVAVKVLRPDLGAVLGALLFRFKVLEPDA